MATKGQNGYPMASSRWKDITLTIHGTDEQIVLPVMSSSRVYQVKSMLAEMVGLDNPSKLEFLLKNRRHKSTDEIASRVIVRGIKSFQRLAQEYPHPMCVIGCGHLGLRQCMEYTRRKLDYAAFDRKAILGGNAWVGIANPTSKLQSEASQYQLQYDVYDGNIEALLTYEEYGYWPSTATILEHFAKVAMQYGLVPHIKLLTEVTDMSITQPPNAHFSEKSYHMAWQSLRDDAEATALLDDAEPGGGAFTCSTVIVYPGALVTPHRKDWPGEELFAGVIGYGFSGEFDYTEVRNRSAIVIGMGAFAHENVRTFCEHGGDRVTVVARHFNLMLPRVICWWMNQSICPPTGAMCLKEMQPMYDLLAWDPWNFHSVTTDASRKYASVKQATRWGISDVFFLAIHYGKADVVNAEVKRFVARGVVLSSGGTLDGIDFCIKVIGFEADFKVDKIMHTQRMEGFWPDGDCRRGVISDQSSIDATRFSSVNLSPAAASFAHHVRHLFQSPMECQALLDGGLLPVTRAQPEDGRPSYLFAPVTANAIWMVVSAAIPAIREFERLNSEMKKASNHLVAPPGKFLDKCREDWDHYCAMFEESGCRAPRPAYPYTLDDLQRMVRMEAELQQQELASAASRQQQPRPQGPEEESRVLEPGNAVSFLPAKVVLSARNRSPSPHASEAEVKWHLQEGTVAKQQLLSWARAAA